MAKIAAERIVRHPEAATFAASEALSDQRQVVCGSKRRPKRRLGREDAPLGQHGRASLFVNLAGDKMALVIVGARHADRAEIPVAFSDQHPRVASALVPRRRQTDLIGRHR
jgi:hypothetical protein